MSQGILIFAQNTLDVDYANLALIAATLSKKYLQKPVSLITDESTLAWVNQSDFNLEFHNIFEHIISIESNKNTNYRILHDGADSKKILFNNFDRCMAYELTPYDETLLIDCDFLIQSDRLNQFWNSDHDYLISESINDVGERSSYLDKYVSDTGPKMYWATTVMFKKTETSRIFFECVKYIKDHYNELALIYGYVPNTYRNDIAFSIAKHIMDGFQERHDNVLPPVLSLLDKDVLIDTKDNSIKVLINKDSFVASSIQGLDIHIMNKQNILRLADKVLKL